MGAVTKQATLPAPSEKVWDALTDSESYAKWNAVHVAFPDGPPELAVGTTYKEQVTMMGMPGEVTWTVAEFDDGKRAVLEGEGPMGVKLRNAYSLEDADGGTAVTLEMEFGGEALAAMEAPLEAAAGKAADDSIAKLEQLLAADEAPRS